MTRPSLPCTAIVSRATGPLSVVHQHVGCFLAQTHEHDWGQLIVAEGGCLQLRTERQLRLLPSNYGIWMPPCTPHEVWSDSPGLFLRTLSFPLDPTTRLDRAPLSGFTLPALLREMIRYTETWTEQLPGPDLLVPFLATLRALLAEMLPQARPLFLPTSAHPRLAPVLARLQHPPVPSPTLPQLARQFGFSERNLSRLFRQELGLSFAGFSQRARILRAVGLIEAGQTNVSELAYQTGYESLSAFSQRFEAICGQRPSAFIRQRQTAR